MRREGNTDDPVLPFDVMLGDRWVCTMKMPITSGTIVVLNGEPSYDITDIRRYVEAKRPSLIGKPYRIELITHKPIFRE